MHDLYVDNHQVICAVSTRQDKHHVLRVLEIVFVRFDSVRDSTASQ